MVRRNGNRNRNWDLNMFSQLGELGGWEISAPRTDLELREGLPWGWAQALPWAQGLQACSPAPGAPYREADRGREKNPTMGNLRWDQVPPSQGQQGGSDALKAAPRCESKAEVRRPSQGCPRAPSHRWGGPAASGVTGRRPGTRRRCPGSVHLGVCAGVRPGPRTALYSPPAWPRRTAWPPPCSEV